MNTYLATFNEADDGTYRWLVYRVTRELGGAMSTLVTMGESPDEDDAWSAAAHAALELSERGEKPKGPPPPPPHLPEASEWVERDNDA